MIENSIGMFDAGILMAVYKCVFYCHHRRRKHIKRILDRKN